MTLDFAALPVLRVSVLPAGNGDVLKSFVYHIKKKPLY